MNVKKISDDIKTQQWMMRIKECRESGKSVKKWCEENNICEQTYYNWLKKLRTVAVESNIIETPAFVPVPVDKPSTDNSKLAISKGDIHIDIPAYTDINVIMNIIKALLC